MTMRMTLANPGRVRIRRRAAMCERMECLRANGHKPIGEQNAQDDQVPDQSAHQETVAARISSPRRRFFRRFLRSSSCFEKYCSKLTPSTVASSGDSVASRLRPLQPPAIFGVPTARELNAGAVRRLQMCCDRIVRFRKSLGCLSLRFSGSGFHSRRLHFSPSVPSSAKGGQTASNPLLPEGVSSLTVASSMVTVLPADDGK